MKAVQVFLGADLRCQHDGLLAMAKKAGVALRRSEAFVFINAKRNRVKTISWNGVLSYLRLDDKRPLDLNALEEIPRSFRADGTMDYNKALRRTLEKKLSKRGRFKELEVVG